MDDLHEALDDLRREIQTDRIELQRTIQDGFDKMHGAMSSHAEDDSMRFEKLNDRLSSLEYDAKVIKRGAGTIIGTIFAAGVTYVVSLFK